MNDNFENFKKEFGHNLKRLRNIKGVTQEILAIDANLADGKLISKIEIGEKDIQLSTIFKLAKGLDVEPKELLDFKKS